MSQSVIIKDESGRFVEVDFSGGLYMLDAAHYRIHEGTMFQADLSALILADDASLELLVRIGVGEGAHMRFSLAAGGDAESYLYEGATVTGAGSAVPIHNRNRRSSRTADVDVRSGFTTSADGTLLGKQVVPGGSGGGGGGGGGGGPGGTPGGQSDSFEEWILKEDTDYVFRLTNRAGSAQVASMTLTWYEPIA